MSQVSYLTANYKTELIVLLEAAKLVSTTVQTWAHIVFITDNESKERLERLSLKRRLRSIGLHHTVVCWETKKLTDFLNLIAGYYNIKTMSHTAKPQLCSSVSTRSLGPTSTIHHLATRCRNSHVKTNHQLQTTEELAIPFWNSTPLVQTVLIKLNKTRRLIAQKNF